MSVGNAIQVLAPKSSEAVNIASADHTFTSKSIVAIYVGTSSGATIVAQLAGDATARTWKNVPQGGYLLGAFVKVVRTGTTAADMVGVTGIYDAPTGA